jgi:hypothetical protein
MYEVVFWVVEMETGGGISDDLFGKLNRHVVGVVGGLDDSTDDESGGDLTKHY